MDLKTYEGKAPAGLTWPAKGTTEGLLWARQWVSEFHKIPEICWLAEKLLASYSGPSHHLFSFSLFAIYFWRVIPHRSVKLAFSNFRIHWHTATVVCASLWGLTKTRRRCLSVQCSSVIRKGASVFDGPRLHPCDSDNSSINPVKTKRVCFI
jgi:hypothetical protein